MGDLWPSRGFVVLYELLNEVSAGVDCEDPRFGETYLSVGKNILQETERVRALSEPACGREEGDTHIWSIPKGSIEGLSLGQKQLLNVTQAGNLEHLWLFLDHLPGMAMTVDREEGKGKARHQRVRRHVWPSLVGYP